MTDADPKDQDPGQEDPKDQDPKDQDPGDGDPGDEDPKDQDPKDGPDPEVKKAQARRDKALQRAQAAEARVKELEEKLNPGKADPVKAANRRLVTAEARVVLTAKGITEPADQKAVMGFLDLDSVDVSDDGEVDGDTITERLETLARVFGKGGGGGRPRTPRVDTRDRGGDRAKDVDPAKKRRMEMLQG